MDQSKIKEVYHLLNIKFAIDPCDVDEAMIVRALEDGDDPEAIADWIGEKYDLEQV